MAEAWKEVRVFISSTFRDMQAERDHLIRFVFPRLRESLLKRRIHLVDVDLRWGVTGDQDAFDLCMDEIKRCHPRFICMLGGRYGWVPAPRTIQQHALDAAMAGESPAGRLTATEVDLLRKMYESDRSTYRLRDKPQTEAEVRQWNEDCEVAVRVLQRARLPEVQFSITASEIHFGALDKLDEPIFRYFYFRDPAVTASIPDKYAGDYREPPGSFSETALLELKEEIKKNKGRVIQTGVSISGDAKLIEPGQIVEAQLPVFNYPCHWDLQSERIADLQEFGERVYLDLLESVDAEFGLAAVEDPDPFAEENASAEAFIETRVERYVVGSRQTVFEQLLKHAEGTGGNGYLCVIGEPGSGKSALLGKFYRDYVNGTGSERPHHNDLVIPHFVGASAASTNVRQLLRRMCHELMGGTSLTEDIPQEYDKLREALPRFLELAAATRQVVILIDAINQLDSADNAHAMRWLPEVVPANVRIIMSTIGSDATRVPALEALRARRAPPIEVPLRSLNESDATAIVEEFLKRYRKTLDPDQRAALLSKSGSGSPLYLLTALEELRTLGTYEEIKNRIEELPPETRALFMWVLGRLENDEGFRDDDGNKVGSRVVNRYCSYLAIGRSGMAQSELVELIAPPVARDSSPDAKGNVAALQRLLRPYLMQRGELLDFFHGQLREAVEEKYLANQEQKAVAHKDLAEYFAAKADPTGDETWTGHYPRALSELPYHQTEAQMWHEVHKTLTDLGFLEAKCTHVAVTNSGSDPDTRKIYGGVYELQEDYRRAIEKMPE